MSLARSNKKTWSPEEDLKLIELVEEFGANNWTVIANELAGGKRSKQCRERYHNHLQADIKKGGWTDEEERLIFELQAEYGNQWAKIATFFPGRTDNSIKNRYNSMMRSMQHKQMKALQQIEQQSHEAVVLPSSTKTPSVSSTSTVPSTTSSCVLYSISAAAAPKRHPLVPTLALPGTATSAPLTIAISGSTRSSSSSSIKMSPYNFSSSRSLLDMAQFKMDGDILETCRSTSSFDMLRAILEDSEGDSSSDEEEEEDYLNNIIPFSARDFCFEDSPTPSDLPSIAPFSSREPLMASALTTDEVILSPWWEERDVLFDLGSVMKKIEISPRQKVVLAPHGTPRSPFLVNLKKQRRGV